MKHPRERASQRESGLTLVELLVAMSISAIVLAALGSLTIATSRSTRNAIQHSQTSREVRGAGDSMMAALRVAAVPPGGTEAITRADASAITFYTMINRTGAAATSSLAPTLVSYSWDSATSCLRQSRTIGVAITPVPATGLQHSYSTGTTTVCVAKTTQPPAFTYYVDATTATPLPFSSGSLSAASRATVRSIGVTLSVSSPEAIDVNPSVVSDRVYLPNLEN